jgi:hypothetical protein
MIVFTGIETRTKVTRRVTDTRARAILGDACVEAGITSPTHIGVGDRIPSKARVVVALGEAAARWLLPETRIGPKSVEEMRGYVFDSSVVDVPVILTVHPASVEIAWSPWRTLLSFDLQRAKELSNAGLRRPEREVFIVSSDRDARQAVSELRRYRRLATDIENDGDTNVSCIGFAGESGRACVFPARYLDDARELLRRTDLTTVWVNGIYDLFVLKHRNAFEVPGHVEDAMLAWHCLPGYQTVETLRGPIPIKELVGRKDIWMWGFDGERPAPVKMKAAFKTRRNAPLVRIKFLRRGKPGNARKWYPSDEAAVEEIVCTPDHRFMLLDGFWCEAQHLRCGDGLMHAKFSTHKNGRRFVNWNRRGKEVSRYVWEYLHGPIPFKHEIHHIDEDFTNDDLENLECLTKKEHNERHEKHVNLDRTGCVSWSKNTIGGASPDYEELEQLYLAGMSLSALATHYRSALPTIKKHLLLIGVQLRTFSEAQKLRRARERNARVLAVEFLDETEDVYCMETSSGNFVVAGLVVHNSAYPELAGARENKRKRRFTRKSLSFLASLATYDPWWKDYAFESGSHEQFILNGRDCCTTLDVWDWTQREVARVGAEDVYEHERSLMWPCVDMLARGLRVDNGLRQRRIAALSTAAGETARGVNELVIPLLERESEALEALGVIHLFQETDPTCACCGHGTKKQMACWACAGFSKAPTKAEMLEDMQVYAKDSEHLGHGENWSKMSKAELETWVLSVCRVCAGAPRETRWTVNANSPDQMKILLYEILKLPKRFSRNGKGVSTLTVDEQALKGLLGGITA